MRLDEANTIVITSTITAISQMMAAGIDQEPKKYDTTAESASPAIPVKYSMRFKEPPLFRFYEL
jgi:hypothetical protein